MGDTITDEWREVESEYYMLAHTSEDSKGAETKEGHLAQ